MLPMQVQVSEWPHSCLALLSTHWHLPIRSGTPAAAAGFDELAGAAEALAAGGAAFLSVAGGALVAIGVAVPEADCCGDSVAVATLVGGGADAEATMGAELGAPAATVGAPRT